MKLLLVTLLMVMGMTSVGLACDTSGGTTPIEQQALAEAHTNPSEAFSDFYVAAQDRLACAEAEGVASSNGQLQLIMEAMDTWGASEVAPDDETAATLRGYAHTQAAQLLSEGTLPMQFVPVVQNLFQETQPPE